MVYDHKSRKNSHRSFFNPAAQFFSGKRTATLPPGKQESKPSGTVNRQGLPPELAANMEAMSGYDLSDVRVHYNSVDAGKMNALAFAKGTDIHIGPGQERHLAHEAWHVVQQKQGRVRATSTIRDEPVNEDASLEREADEMGAKAMGRTVWRHQPVSEEGRKRGCVQCRVVQKYDDDTWEAALGLLTHEQLFDVFAIESEEIRFQPHGRSEITFTSAWVNSPEGIAALRAIIRFKIQRMVLGGNAEQVDNYINGTKGNADRIAELRNMLVRAIERAEDPSIPNAGIIASSLIEEGGQGRTMARRGRLRTPLERRAGESDAAYNARVEQKENEVHAAMDVRARTGTAIYTPVAGSVVWAGPGDNNSAGYGIFVKILHNNPPPTQIAGDRAVSTHYCHLSAALVATGDRVFAGQAIGLVGTTRKNAQGNPGRVRGGMGAHLHFGVEIVENPDEVRPRISSVSERATGINPAIWLNELGVRLSETGYERMRERGERGRMAYP